MKIKVDNMWLFRYMIFKLKQLGCRHRYSQVYKCSGRYVENDKQIVFNYDFECVKCGKRITIIMDEDSQIADKGVM